MSNNELTTKGLSKQAKIGIGVGVLGVLGLLGALIGTAVAKKKAIQEDFEWVDEDDDAIVVEE